jgi:uncharacterized protein YfaS (alpha-2-macroglobulin family)
VTSYLHLEGYAMSRTIRNRVAGCAFLVVVGVAVLVAAENPPGPTNRADRWKKVEEAVKKGLPKSAIQELEPIIESAIKDKAYPEAIKAISKKIALEGNIEGNKPEERIIRMETAIAAAPVPMKPTMHALLGLWYWHYYQQNQWRFLNRTQTAAQPGKDFTTWDLPRLFSEIDKHFTTALAAEQELKATPIKTFDALLVKGNLSDDYRPTLYDFLAFEALTFYTAAEQAGAKPEDAFEIDSASPILAPVGQFLKWKPDTTDTDSPKLRAITIYQSLLAFHKDDQNKTAYLDADLHRLRWGYNVAFGPEKADRYKAALKDFANTWGDHELSALARYYLAEVENNEGSHAEAREIAQQAVKTFPNSHGGKMAFNLIQQIEAKAIQLTTERVWADPQSVIRVRYKNITKVHFRAYPADWTARLTQGRYRPEQLNDNDRHDLLARKPSAAWSADLPATTDFAERTADVAPPTGLKPGFYFVFASVDPAFRESGNVIAATDVWVSDLAMVIRQEWTRGRLEGFVLRAESGEPIVNASVLTWVYTNNNVWANGPVLRTDENGLFRLEAQGGNGWVFLADHNGHQLASMHNYHLHNNPQFYKPQAQTVLFTDRSLYRPGQTVHYKGITLLADQHKDEYTVLPNKALTVIFNDPNGEEIARHDVKTNDFGSFSGSFTAPRDRLTGRMFIHVPGDAPGSAQLSVEEYKRPKFKVTLDAPKDAPKLNSSVRVTGKAIAYTGAPIGGAKVRYRVTREVRWPDWFGMYFWWRMPSNRGESQEIAHGTAITAADGSFEVTFTAKPDLSVPEKDEPTFHYTIAADVTDTAGETRSDSRSIAVGYTALQANLTASQWLTADQDVKVTLSTQTLDGEWQEATGTVKVYRLKQPETVQRPEILDRPTPVWPRRGLGRPAPDAPPQKPDPSDPRTWELGEVVATEKFATDAGGKKELTFKLPAGPYRVVAEMEDRSKKPVTARTDLQVLNPSATKLDIKVPHLFTAPKWSLEPGETFTALWGTGYDTGRAYVEVEHRGKVIQSRWTDADKTQFQLAQKITEEMRGGFTVRVTYVRENRSYLETRRVDVPWSNKDLTLKWERFVSKLEPAKKETFTAVVSGPKAQQAVAEMVATLYDASLDAYLPHQWMQRFHVFRQDRSHLNSQFDNVAKGLQHLVWGWSVESKPVELRYRSFPNDLTANLWGYMFFEGRGGFGGGMRYGIPAPTAAMAKDAAVPESQSALGEPMADRAARRQATGISGRDKNAVEEIGAQDTASGPDLSKVSARKNLNELAFFFPHLTTGSDGSVRMEFTMPEALTTWKFMGFAHDRDLRSGYLQDEVVTAKDLMVQPNPPRFLREGDVLEFSIKVSNQSPTRQTGKVRLTFTDTVSQQPVDANLGNTSPEQSFDIPAGEGQSFFWRISVPDGLGPITYTAVGATDKLSDGEEGVIPILSKRVLVTESLPLPIRGKQTKTFDFAKLRESAKSDTLRHQSLTVQMTSQPAWYAVMALPYLMEFPYECSEQTFNRLYANTIARHVATSDPKIRRVFDQWKNTPALDSPLQKNEELKAVTLQETPWLQDAVKESEARRNVGILFDDTRLSNETARAFRKLSEMQLPDGTWPWFPGGPSNEYITLYITTGFGRLRHLGAGGLDMTPAIKSLTRLDAWMHEHYQHILKHSKNPEDNHLTPIVALYLYGRSFYLADKPVAPEHQEGFAYWQRQARNHWLKLANRQSQAHLALALHRLTDFEAAQGIMKSIKERSVSSEELGLFWRDTERSWWWYHAPIETQAVMIEAFDEVMNDATAVEDAKVWLLKQKQTQNWRTTKATADAVYALLRRGSDLLKSEALVTVTVGDLKIEPDKVEVGTGFYEQRFVRNEIIPEMGTITVTKPDEGVSWGNVTWQYLEDVSKVTPHEGTPLKLEKKLFKRVLTKKGPILEEVNGPVAVGDEMVCRIILRTDRDMEYVHLKDHRGSGTEPVNVLSQYKYQDGLAYYESTKDTASHFFIDYLPKGVYVFEYAVRVQHKGTYPTGLASIQCMYAPEFNSHSESITLEVK